MQVNTEDYVVRQGDHLLMFTSYFNQMTFEEYYYARPCASVFKATTFKTEDEAREMIQNVKTLDLSDTEIIQIAQIEKEEKEKADKESDEIIKNAWSNTSRAKQEEMLDNLRNTKGEQAVSEWLAKYGPLNEETEESDV